MELTLSSGRGKVYVQGEAGRGPTLIFLHSFGGSGRSWQGVISKLSSEAYCLAPDLRGFGSWNAATPSYLLEDYTADLGELIEQLGLKSYILVGHSMGGKIALLFAAGRPAGLSGLVLVAASPPTPEPMEDVERNRLLTSYGQPEPMLETVQNITNQPLSPTLREQTVQDYIRSAPGAWKSWLEIGSRVNITGLMPNLKPMPILAIVGTADSVISEKLIRSEILPYLEASNTIKEPDNLIKLPKVGHLLPLEAPEALARAIQFIFKY